MRSPERQERKHEPSRRDARTGSQQTTAKLEFSVIVRTWERPIDCQNVLGEMSETKPAEPIFPVSIISVMIVTR